MSDFRYWLRASYTAMTASVLFLFSSSAAADDEKRKRTDVVIAVYDALNQ